MRAALRAGADRHHFGEGCPAALTGRGLKVKVIRSHFEDTTRRGQVATVKETLMVAHPAREVSVTISVRQASRVGQVSVNISLMTGARWQLQRWSL